VLEAAPPSGSSLPVEFAMNEVSPHRHHLSAKVRSIIDLLAHPSDEHRKLRAIEGARGLDWFAAMQ
jgi:hypothetical protein